jgi:hypothetical protein
MSSNTSTYIIVFAAGVLILMLLSTVKNHKQPKKIKAIWHGHVVWQKTTDQGQPPTDQDVWQPSHKQDVWQPPSQSALLNMYTVHGPKTRPDPINFDADIKAIEDARILHKPS